MTSLLTIAVVKYLSLATSTIILRCHRSHYQLLWAALTFMDHVPVSNGRPCLFRVVRVSGTIRKAEEEAIRQARKLILHAKAQNEKNDETSGFLGMARETEQAMTDIVDAMSDDDMDTDDG
jgi:ribonuclease P/MRP protein subunit POP5